MNNKALAIMSTALKADSKFQTHINACVHCGLCGTSCMYSMTYAEPRFFPTHKVALVYGLYKRYFTPEGRIAPFLFGAKEMTPEYLQEMVDLLYGGCTMCGRCVKHCSIGVDIPYIVHKGREMLAALGMVPASLQSTVDAALNTGNNMGIPKEDFIDTVSWMSEEEEVPIALDQEGVEIMYTVNPREPKFFPLSIAAMAKIFAAAGASWTLPTTFYDVTNYGFFSGNDQHAKQLAANLYNTAKELKVKRLVLGECGHGARASRWEGPNYLQTAYPMETITVVELIGQYIRSGAIRLDKTRNNKRYTMHDPCNLVRNGGLFNELRFVINQAVLHFTEMTPFGTDNYCCGGGGGQLAMSEYNERRLQIGKIKADQIKATGAQVVVTPCHNCVDQLLQLNHYYKLGVEIKTIAEVVADALIS